MMYQTIKDNIINPKVLLVRTKDRFLKTFGFFFFFTTLLALPAIIDVVAFQTLTPNDKTVLRQSLSGDLNIPREINQTLQCEGSEPFLISQGNVLIVFDANHQYQQTDDNLFILLQHLR